MREWLRWFWYKTISWTGRWNGYCSSCEVFCKYHLFKYKGIYYCYDCLSKLVIEAEKYLRNRRKDDV